MNELSSVDVKLLTWKGNIHFKYNMVSYWTQAKDVMGPLEIPGDEKITGSGWNDLPLVIFCLHNWATLFSEGLCLLWCPHGRTHRGLRWSWASRLESRPLYCVPILNGQGRDSGPAGIRCPNLLSCHTNMAAGIHPLEMARQFHWRHWVYQSKDCASNT